MIVKAKILPESVLNSEPLAPILSQALEAKPDPHSGAQMDPSCTKVVTIRGTSSVPEIGTKSGAKVHKLVPFSGTDLVPENGTKNGPKTGTRMQFVYDFRHFEQF